MHSLIRHFHRLFPQMKRTAKALDWIIGSMVERGQGSKTGPPALVDIDKRREERKYCYSMTKSCVVKTKK